jgi:hypothetical protein
MTRLLTVLLTLFFSLLACAAVHAQSTYLVGGGPMVTNYGYGAVYSPPAGYYAPVAVVARRPLVMPRTTYYVAPAVTYYNTPMAAYSAPATTVTYYGSPVVSYRGVRPRRVYYSTPVVVPRTVYYGSSVIVGP